MRFGSEFHEASLFDWLTNWTGSTTRRYAIAYCSESRFTRGSLEGLAKECSAISYRSNSGCGQAVKSSLHMYYYLHPHQVSPTFRLLRLLLRHHDESPFRAGRVPALNVFASRATNCCPSNLPSIQRPRRFHSQSRAILEECQARLLGSVGALRDGLRRWDLCRPNEGSA